MAIKIDKLEELKKSEAYETKVSNSTSTTKGAESTMKRLTSSLTTDPSLLTEPFAIEGILGEISRHHASEAEHLRHSMPSNQQARPSNLGAVQPPR